GPVPARFTQALQQFAGVERRQFDFTLAIDALFEVLLKRREIGTIEFKAKAAVAPDQLAHELEVDRLTINRQAHDLVLFTEPFKADELTKGRIEEPKRMWHMHPVQNFDLVTLAARKHSRGEIAGSIVRKPGCLIEIAGVIGTGDMGKVMLDPD